jgi:hypothetical protein
VKSNSFDGQLDTTLHYLGICHSTSQLKKKKALESQLHASGVQWTPGMLNVPCASSLIFFPSTTNLKSSKFDDNVGGFQVEELENFQIFMP